MLYWHTSYTDIVHCYLQLNKDGQDRWELDSWWHHDGTYYYGTITNMYISAFVTACHCIYIVHRKEANIVRNTACTLTLICTVDIDTYISRIIIHQEHGVVVFSKWDLKAIYKQWSPI